MVSQLPGKSKVTVWHMVLSSTLTWGTVCSGVGRGGEVCKGEAKSLSKHYKRDKATGLQFLDFDKPPVKCSHLNVNREEFHFSQ